MSKFILSLILLAAFVGGSNAPAADGDFEATSADGWHFWLHMNHCHAEYNDDGVRVLACLQTTTKPNGSTSVEWVAATAPDCARGTGLLYLVGTDGQILARASVVSYGSSISSEEFTLVCLARVPST